MSLCDHYPGGSWIGGGTRHICNPLLWNITANGTLKNVSNLKCSVNKLEWNSTWWCWNEACFALIHVPDRDGSTILTLALFLGASWVMIPLLAAILSHEIQQARLRPPIRLTLHSIYHHNFYKSYGYKGLITFTSEKMVTSIVRKKKFI